MNYYRIIKKTLGVFQECKIQSFPFDCEKLLTHYGYTLYTYEELQEINLELYIMCRQYSEDAFRDGNSMIIAYNENKPYSRIRFSLMHELGHHILGHKRDCPENEKEANAFASNLLAPRMAIHFSKCKGCDDVRSLFLLSPKASEYAFCDYQRWYRLTAYNAGLLDKEMYSHFYNSDAGTFVWKISNCDFCQKPIYNASRAHCKNCVLPDEPVRRIELYRDDNDIVLQRMHQKWLYEDCY